jgi:hypothetical protein
MSAVSVGTLGAKIATRSVRGAARVLLAVVGWWRNAADPRPSVKSSAAAGLLFIGRV